MDNITRPSWYYNGGKASVGPLDYAEQQDLGIDAHAVVKYVTRAGRKPGSPALKDLKQAKFYIDRMIAREERGGRDMPVLARHVRTGPVDRRKCNDNNAPYSRRHDDSGIGPQLGRRKTDAVRWLDDLPKCKRTGLCKDHPYAMNTYIGGGSFTCSECGKLVF